MDNNRKSRKIKYSRRDNRGVSMLEVIIAVSIFSVAAAVLMQGFVTSARINKKSGLYLEATSTAQNIMEEIKARSFEEVALAFNYPIDNKSGGETRFQFLNTQKSEINSGALAIYEAVPIVSNGKTEYAKLATYREDFNGDTSKVNASIISTDDGNTYEFNPRKDSKYYFVMKNVKNDNETFDVLVEFDGSETSGYKSDDNKMNNYQSPNIIRLDTKTNAIFELKKSDIKKKFDEKGIVVQYNSFVDEEWSAECESLRAALNSASDDQKAEFQAALDALQNNKPPQITWEDLRAQTSMKLEFKIEKDATGTVTVKAKTTYDASKYKREGGKNYESMAAVCSACASGNPADSHICKIVQDDVIGTFSGENELKGLFLLYDPNYASVSETEPLDEIFLDNTANQEILFYVIKQKHGDSPTSNQEINYRVMLEIKDMPANYKKSWPNWKSNADRFRSVTELRTNLNTNIAKDAVGRTDINQLGSQWKLLTYWGADPSDPNKRTGNTKKRKTAYKILNMKGLEAKEAEDRIFTARVSVYKAGAAAEGFPNDQLVASLDGAKEK